MRTRFTVEPFRADGKLVRRQQKASTLISREPTVFRFAVSVKIVINESNEYVAESRTRHSVIPLID